MRRPLLRRVARAATVCASLALLDGRALGQVAAGSRAGADSPLRLNWTSSVPGCDGGVVAARALQMVGPRVTPRPVEARAKLSQDGKAWIVELETQSADHTGTRTLRGESCHEIQEALALLLAMILEGEVEAAPPQTTSAPAAPPRAEPQPVPAPPPTPATDPLDAGTKEPSPPSERSEIGLLLRLDGDAALGLKPGLGVGVGGAVGLFWGRWDLALVGTYWPETLADIGGERPGQIAIARRNLGLRSCFGLWQAAEFSLAPCLSGEVTSFRYRALGIAEAGEGSVDHLLLSGTAGLDFRYRLMGSRVSIVLSPGVTLEKRQPFQIPLICEAPACDITDPPDPLQPYETNGGGPRIKIGVAARF